MNLQPGQTVGDYEVLGILGAGGMGSVYKVRNIFSDRVDAMKVLLPDLVASPEIAERFLREIKVLAGMRHPNIAALYTASRVGDRLVMIMEYVDGVGLEQRLKAGAMPPGEAVSYAMQFLSALAYAHDHGVVHRDIKPANIAINTEDTVKLLDFGIARAAASIRHTQTGMVLGSLYYMSPEQVRGEPVDSRSDLYSAGITLYRMVTGRYAVEGDSQFAIMQAQASVMPVAPRQWNDAIPPGLSDNIMRSLEKKPSDRYQSAAEFRQALAPYLDLAPSTLVPQPEADTRVMGASMVSNSRFHAASLDVLRKHLSIALGPIAAALVKRQSQTAPALPDLIKSLAAQIGTEADRQAFLKACLRDLGPEALGTAAQELAYATPVPAAPVTVTWDPQVLERSKKLLAGFIGPLARVVVDRAAKKAQNVDELFAILSAEISSPQDREKFLSNRAAILR